MNTQCPFQQKNINKAITLALLTLSGFSALADTVDLGTVGGSSGVSAAVTTSLKADRGTAASVAPTQANLNATQPQSFISRSYI